MDLLIIFAVGYLVGMATSTWFNKRRMTAELREIRHELESIANHPWNKRQAD